MTSPRLEETRPAGTGRARGLVSSRVAGRLIEARTFAPSADLADVIACHWMGRWELPEDAPHTTELLGDPCMHIVFERSEKLRERRLVGVWTRLWRRTLEGRGMVRGVKLRPGAGRAFVAQAVHGFTCRIVPLSIALEATHTELARAERAVLDPEDACQGFLALEPWLRARRLPDVDGHISLAVALVDRVAKDPAITSTEALAAVAGLGPRALQRLFREHVGATPKWVIRRNRLQEVALRIELGDAPSLAALAAELGYADQAHLARDFKAAVGKSPREFAASVQR